MTGIEKLDNDAGRYHTKIMEDAFKEGKNKLTKEKIKKTVKNFFSAHSQKELTVSVYLDSEHNESVCTFHISAQDWEVTENTAETELVISDFITPKTALIPDKVEIPYDKAVGCKADTVTGEGSDIAADVLIVTFKNGTVIELEFLNM